MINTYAEAHSTPASHATAMQQLEDTYTVTTALDGNCTVYNPNNS